jgi:hypothetical protein
MALIVLLNNFMHDFSAAGWLFASLLLLVILRKHSGEIKTSDSLADLTNFLLLLTRICLAGIILFGIGRVLGYKKYEWNPIAGQGQVTLLIIKHVIFTVVFVAGMICYFKAVNIVRKIKDDQNE